VKTFGIRAVDTSFDRNFSVFSDWKEDTPEKLEQACRHDLQNWKGEKFIKAGHLDQVAALVRKHMSALKQIHTYYAALSSHYPYMGSLEFWSLIDRLNYTK